MTSPTSTSTALAGSDEELDRLIDVSSALVALPIDEACRPGVRQFVRIAGEMAAALDVADLDPSELALASVYTAPRRDEDDA